MLHPLKNAASTILLTALTQEYGMLISVEIDKQKSFSAVVDV